MRKRIISLFSALIMTVSMSAPAFAYTSVIYSDLKNAPRSELRSLFNGNFSEFDISRDGRTYDDSTKSLIILEARQRGFSSFEELNQVITQVADEIFEKRANPKLLGLSGISSDSLSFSAPRETDPADMFSVGGRDFIVIDKVTEDGEDMFYVMAKDYFGTIALDPDNLGRWTDNNSRLTPYKLTNSMAFGNYSSGNLPEEILAHMDILHEWNVEPGSGAGFQKESVLIAPISCISLTEYKKYGKKIGLDRQSGLYWTRTPVLGSSEYHFTINTAVANKLGKNKGWGGNQLRPVFYLKSSFFKEEKMDKCGGNVTAYLEEVLSLSDINNLYSASEIKNVFGGPCVTPQPLTGSAVVGETLSTDYTYSGNATVLNVDITWERSADKITWTQIPGASGKTYRITKDDTGYYIRAAFAPTFDSVIFKDGSITYSGTADAVYDGLGAIQAEIYAKFKNASHSELRTTFFDNFSRFDISQDGRTYDDSTKSLIILEASQRGYSDFEELNSVITQVADEIFEKRANPKLLGLSGISSDGLSFSAPRKTSQADVFSIGGKEFILIDKVTEDGEDMFFVMAKDYIGTIALDPDNLGRWTDTSDKLAPYKFTNSMAFGNHTGGNLPEEILTHMDMLHEWNVEPGSGAGFQQETVLIAPISCISLTEYKKYGEKIGLDKESGLYWTRTPVLGSSEYHFTVNAATPNKLGLNKGWGGNLLRPVFYLKSSFFKEEKMEKCGENVTAYIEEELDVNDINSLYSSSEIKDVFGSLCVTPLPINGNAIVGQTLSADYTYKGNAKVLNVDITWERSSDKITWIPISGASGKTYLITNYDAGCYIRAVFTPTFDSIILKDGSATYSIKADAVYTDAGIVEAVSKIEAAQDTATLRALLAEYESLLHLDSSTTAFPENAAKIFLEDEVKTISDILVLYNQSIALDLFAGASGDDIKEKAESQYLMGSIPEYAKMTSAQKDSLVTEIYNLGDEKKKVSKFMAKARELIMITRFNNIEREAVPSLVREYATVLGVDISGLSAYQLEMVAPYVACINFGNDLAKLVAAVKDGVAKAKNTSVPSAPVEGNTQGGSYSDGFIPPSYEKLDPAESEEERIFTDLDSVPWGIAAINSLAKKGIISGNGNGTFAPMDPVTRNEFVKMIVSAFNVALEGEDVSFEDIPQGSWSEKYIKAAVNAGIIAGVDDTHFGNGMNITRQDVAVISDRLMAYKEIELKSSSLKFADSYEISEYALMSVAKMCYNGIMNGVDENTFAPKGTATRAQAAVVVYNLLNYYNDKIGAGQEEEGDGENTLVMRTVGDKYDVVFNLGILKEEFGNDPIITRGELAAALAVFGKYDCFKAEGIFGDVKASHQYSSEIEAVYSNNIMAPKTANTFMPDEPATYGEAYNAIIAASGYANFEGGTSEIESILRKEPVYAQKSDQLTISMAKKLFYAALGIPVFTMGDLHSVVKINKTILNENFDVYREKGVLNVVAGMSLGGRADMSDDKIVITVDGKDYLYYSDSNYDYSDYLGFEVTYYYTETNTGCKIISMVADSKKEPLNLSFRDIISAERNLSAITYNKGTRTKKVTIARNADFIYNGKRSYAITEQDLAPDNGYVTLIDTNMDNQYDVVKIEKYEYIMVAQVNARGKTILDRFTWQTFSFDEEKDAEKINITKNGRYIKMDYLQPGDILAIARSRDGSLINAYVSDSKVSGKVTDIMSDEYAIVLDGNVLNCVKNFNFEGLTNSVNITVGLDWNGYAVGYYTELVGIESKIGYFYKMYTTDDDSIMFNVLTQDNEYVTIETADRVIANGIRARSADLNALFSYNETSRTMTPQLVSYDLNAEGKMTKLYTSYTDNGVVSTQTTPLVLNKFYNGDAPPVIYNNFGMTLNFEYNLLKSAVMFDITLDGGVLDKESSFVTNVGAQTITQSNKPERFFIYNADIAKISSLCVYEHSPMGGNQGYKEVGSSQAFLVNKISTKYDEKQDQIVTVYKGYHNGNPVEYSFSEKLMKEFDTSKIKPGDVLLVWLSGTEINRFRRLFALEEEYAIVGETDLLCNYGDKDYNGEETGSLWEPNNIAQHLIESAEKQNQNSTSASTRWASLYGTLELVLKSEIYPQPVLKLKIAGKNEAQAYTLDSNTKVYVYSKSDKSVSVLDGDSMNYTMKKAVVTARYGNVRDVIIYED